MVTDTQGNESVGSDNVQSTGTENSGAVGTSSTNGEMSNEKLAAPSEGTAEEKLIAAYQPNFKFKVLDQEKEIDEWLKPAIKDADTEKKVRELYERAYGLDHVKGDRQRIRDSFTSFQNEVAPQLALVSRANDLLAKKDYDTLLGTVLKIPEDDILKQAHKILQMREMPPEQRQALEHARQASQRLYELENQNQYLSQSHEQVAVQARTQELDWTLQRPDVSQLATAYDTRAGKQGAFRQAVIERGQYRALTSGRDLSPEQAVQEVLQFLGGPTALIPAPQNAQANMQMSQPVSQDKKPVITNIQGRGTSPAKKVIKSLDGLRQKAKEMAAEESL